MATARNRVLAGDYMGCKVSVRYRAVTLRSLLIYAVYRQPQIVSCQEMLSSSQTNAGSAVRKAALGAFVLGPAGLAAGLGAAVGSTHTVAVEFSDGRRSLLELDGKNYQELLKAAF